MESGCRLDMLIPVNQQFQVDYCIYWEEYLKSKCISLRKKQSCRILLVELTLCLWSNQGKGSFAYAWALDENAEEGERGITMTMAVAYFNTKMHHVVLLDSPRTQRFCSEHDSRSNASRCCDSGHKGQTREHARVLRGFGVEQVIVAVNKMDIVAYSKDKFDLIKQQIAGSFPQSCRFKE